MIYTVKIGFSYGETKIYPNWRIKVEKGTRTSKIIVYNPENTEIISGQILNAQLEKIERENLETPEKV